MVQNNEQHGERTKKYGQRIQAIVGNHFCNSCLDVRIERLIGGSAAVVEHGVLLYSKIFLVLCVSIGDVSAKFRVRLHR